MQLKNYISKSSLKKEHFNKLMLFMYGLIVQSIG